MTYEEQVLRRDLNRTRDDIGAFQRGIKELERAEHNATSDKMKEEFGQVVLTKQAALKQLVIKADEIKDKLVAAELPQKPEVINPHAHLHRGQISEDLKMEIIKDYGVDKYMEMPL